MCAKTIMKVGKISPKPAKVILVKKKSSSVKGFKPQIRSRHPSHNGIRRLLAKMPFRSVIRFGSTTEMIDTIARGGKRVEINTTEAVKNSADKLRMKKCFTAAGAKTAEWWTTNNGSDFIEHSAPGTPTKRKDQLKYPIVAKHRFGSRGRGNTLLNNVQELERFVTGKDLSNYIFEKFYNYNREYRLHVTKDGCFYTCRKMLKNETPKNQRWFRNDSNSVWIVETNPAFQKPSNWDAIVVDCIKALNGVGLHVGACDVRVSSNSGRNSSAMAQKFVIIEINSAPSFGEGTEKAYTAKLPELLKEEYGRQNSARTRTNVR